MIKVDQVLIGDKVVAADMNGIVDTGTSLMVASPSVLGDLAAIPVDNTCQHNAALPDVTFVISGVH